MQFTIVKRRSCCNSAKAESRAYAKDTMHRFKDRFVGKILRSADEDALTSYTGLHR